MTSTTRRAGYDPGLTKARDTRFPRAPMPRTSASAPTPPAGLLALAATLAAATSVSTQQPPSAPKSLVGQVVDAEGHSVVGAEIVMRWRIHPELPGLLGMTLENDGVAETTHVSREGGRFRIAPPHRGPFLLLARHNGSSSAHAFPAMAGDSFRLQLEPDYAFGGVVTHPDGKPAADVPVTLIPHWQTWTRLAFYRLPERRASCRTDSEGRFRLGYEHGYTRGRWWGAFAVPWVETAGMAGPTLRVVRPGRLAREQGITLQPGQRVAGRVVAAGTREPIAGATLRDPYRPLDAVQTDAQGRFELQAHGRQAWRVRAKGWAPGEVEVRTAKPEDESDADLVVEIARGLRLRAILTDGRGDPLANARVLFALTRRGKPPDEWGTRTDAQGVVTFSSAPRAETLLGFVEIRGRFAPFWAAALSAHTDAESIRVVTDRVVHGQVVGPDNAPVASARLALLADKAPADTMPRITYSDHGGRFRFEAVAEGRHVLLCDGAEHGLGSLTVQAERDSKPARLVLPDGAHIGGVVVDEAGAPVPGAWLTIVRNGGGVANREAPAPSLGMTALCSFTNAKGRFHFKGLPPDSDWTILCNWLREGEVGGGGRAVYAGHTDVVVSTRSIER